MVDGKDKGNEEKKKKENREAKTNRKEGDGVNLSTVLF